MYILVIEDNPDLVANLYDFLEARGHVVDVAYDGHSGLEFATRNRYDLLVLDLMLPDIDGLEVCRHLRAHGREELPILMLTARDTLQDKLDGFAQGADDYMVKPFALLELEARLLALARRSLRQARNRRLQVADLVLDPATLEVSRAGQAIKLAPIALKILKYLMRQAPRVVPRQELERHIWSDDRPETDALRAHIYMLRAAVDKPFSEPLIHTVHGIGFKIADREQDG